jgi:hypothetical protein
MKLVLEAGHSKEEISARMLAVNLAQKLRTQSIDDRGWGSFKRYFSKIIQKVGNAKRKSSSAKTA